MHTADSHWATPSDDMPVPLYRIEAETERAQRDRSLLLMALVCAVAMLATVA